MKYSLQTEIGKFNCPTHGKVASKIFVMPEPYEGKVAHYQCAHCWIAKGEPEYDHPPTTPTDLAQ